jgi:hypothetical protein
MPVIGLDHMIGNAIIDAEVSGINLFFKLPELASADFESQLEELREEVIDGDSNK